MPQIDPRIIQLLAQLDPMQQVAQATDQRGGNVVQFPEMGGGGGPGYGGGGGALRSVPDPRGNVTQLNQMPRWGGIADYRVQVPGPGESGFHVIGPGGVSVGRFQHRFQAEQFSDVKNAISPFSQ